jgi:hypothetical protein
MIARASAAALFCRVSLEQPLLGYGLRRRWRLPGTQMRLSCLLKAAFAVALEKLLPTLSALLPEVHAPNFLSIPEPEPPRGWRSPGPVGNRPAITQAPSLRGFPGASGAPLSDDNHRRPSPAPEIP